MDDVRASRSAPASLALAATVRQFSGSRIERQLLVQVFDLVWQARSDATMVNSPEDNRQTLAPTEAVARSLVATLASVRTEGGRP